MIRRSTIFLMLMISLLGGISSLSANVSYTHPTGRQRQTVDRETQGNLKTLTTTLRPNSTRQRLTLDNADRLTGTYEEKMSGTAVVGTLWQAGYGYDLADRLTSYTPTPIGKTRAPPATTMTSLGVRYHISTFS